MADGRWQMANGGCAQHSTGRGLRRGACAAGATEPKQAAVGVGVAAAVWAVFVGCPLLTVHCARACALALGASRPVHLIQTQDRLHFEHQGVFVSTNVVHPNEEANGAPVGAS